MRKEQTDQDRRLRHTGLAGIGIGLLTLLACELPIILALAGLGGLSSFVSIFKPGSTLELVGLAIGTSGILLVTFIALKRISKFGKAKYSIARQDGDTGAGLTNHPKARIR